MTSDRSLPSDTARFAVAGRPVQPVQLGYGAVLEGRAVIHRLARELPPETADLMEIATTAFVVDQLAARPGRIDAPAMTSTKAQLILRAPAAAGSALTRTVSCDTGFSARVPDRAPCGVRTSCLLRRQALHAAGRDDLDAGADYRVSALEEVFELQAMLRQVSRLRACLDQADPWRALVSEYPELLDTVPLTPVEVTSLYRSYVQEWEDLPEAFRSGRTAAL